MIKAGLRNLGWISTVDYLRYKWIQMSSREKNEAFRKAHPGFALPQDFFLYETFRLDYEAYFNSGKETALWLLKLIQPHLAVHQIHALLDWGCGPARVIRHFPELLPASVVCHGCDYNEQFIHWNRNHIKGISFKTTPALPPTDYSDQQFQFIYGISIFTHLSSQGTEAWMSEMYRLLSPGGVMVFTTHGENFMTHLSETEKAQFSKGEPVIHQDQTEGYRTYGTFHPPAYIRNLLEPRFKIVQHIPGKQEHWGQSQDTWVIQRLYQKFF